MIPLRYYRLERPKKGREDYVKQFKAGIAAAVIVLAITPQVVAETGPPADAFFVYCYYDNPRDPPLVYGIDDQRHWRFFPPRGSNPARWSDEQSCDGSEGKVCDFVDGKLRMVYKFPSGNGKQRLYKKVVDTNTMEMTDVNWFVGTTIENELRTDFQPSNTVNFSRLKCARIKDPVAVGKYERFED